ncbi:MAG: YitT family protein [Eubacteriales bacterium]|nr:YitT family protein [Eubacteriales bacterium]
MEKYMKKEFGLDLAYEFVGNVLIAAATYNVAVASKFPLCGFNGIAMVLYRMFHTPIGMAVLVMNIIPALICVKTIGKDFVLKTLRCMIISTILIDYVAPLFPTYAGDRMIAAIVTGVLYGLGYSLIYVRGSSTGGSDFIMIIIKSYFPHIKTGTITFLLDFGVVVATGLIFKDIDGIFLGIMINYIMAAVIDKTILGMNSGNVAMIITDHSQEVKLWIDEVSERGCTIFHAEGGYKGDPRDVVMVAGSNRDIYNIRKVVKMRDPRSFVIVMQSHAVDGEGFQMTTIAGE